MCQRKLTYLLIIHVVVLCGRIFLLFSASPGVDLNSLLITLPDILGVSLVVRVLLQRRLDVA
jgi:hypothetical protein